MKIQRKREIVIEFERVRIMRRKARTHFVFCRRCAREVDFVTLREAAALFTATGENLLQFARVNDTHFESGADGEVLLCLVSFLGAMKAKTNLSRIKLIGD